MYSNPEKLAEIATLFGKDTTGMDKNEAAKVAVDAVYELLDSLPIPPLSSYGVTEDDIPKLSEEAMKGGDRGTNPRETVIEDFYKLYKKTLTLKAE